jgi:hypothetical protein
MKLKRSAPLHPLLEPSRGAGDDPNRSIVSFSIKSIYINITKIPITPSLCNNVVL